MGRKLIALTQQTIDQVPEPCRHCAFWELGHLARRRGSAEAGLQKEALVASAALEWGLAGHVISVDGTPAGYSLFAPTSFFGEPGSQAARPVSRDAALLATLMVAPDFRGQGLGRVLLQSMARELHKRKVRGAEAFADRLWQPSACYVPAAFLEACGFQIKREHPRFPLLRMDLRSTVRWRGVGEAAMDALRAPAGRALRPVPGGQPTVAPSRGTPRTPPSERPVT